MQVKFEVFCIKRVPIFQEQGDLQDYQAETQTNTHKDLILWATWALRKIQVKTEDLSMKQAPKSEEMRDY